MKLRTCFLLFLFIFNVQNSFAKDSTPDSTATSLNQSLQNAFIYSPNLQRVQEARQRAEHDVRKAEAAYYPTIGIWGGLGFLQEDNPGTRADRSDGDFMGNSTASLLLSQKLWQGGATSSIVRSSESNLEYNMFAVLDDATTLAYTTISAHADVLRRRQLLKLSQINVTEHRKILKLLRSRFDQGLSSEGDVEQVVSRLNRAQATLLTHQEGLDAALANYRRMTGQHAPKNLLPVKNPDNIFENADSVRDESVKNNFRLKAILAQIDSLVADRDFAKSSFAPSFTFDTGPTYQNTDSGGDAHALSWTAMVNMRWNLYNGGADEANFKASTAKVREARKSLHATMDTLDEQIQLVYNRTQTATRQTGYFEKASKASRIARDNFFAQFTVGKKDLLNVLDAENEAFSSKVDAVIARIDAILGHYRLHALAGTLLSTVGLDQNAIKKGTPSIMPIDDVKILTLKLSPHTDVNSRIVGMEESTLQRD